METVGLGFFFEDLTVGRQFKTIGRTVTEADITNFVNATGMVEVLFTNRASSSPRRATSRAAQRPARWSMRLPRGSSSKRRCSTPGLPFSTWN